MANLDDNQIIAMLAEMRDSPPPILPIKSPQKNHSDSEDEIPSSQPAPPHVQMQQEALNKPAQQTTSSRQSQPPNFPRWKWASAICATRSHRLRPGTPRQRSSSLFFENTPTREPAELVCHIGPSHTSDETRTFKPVFTMFYIRLYICWLGRQASPVPSTLNQTGNRHHNHKWHWKTIWNAQNLRLSASLFQTKTITFQDGKGRPWKPLAQTNGPQLS